MGVYMYQDGIETVEDTNDFPDDAILEVCGVK
jgi:hypothetical protein